MSDKDEMGNALVQMRDSLKTADEDNRQRHWTSAGIAQVNRTPGSTAKTSTDSAMSSFLPSWDTWRRIMARCTSWNARRPPRRELDPASGQLCPGRTRQSEAGNWNWEGLVGQCIKDKKSIWLKDAPVHFARIHRALATRTPRM